MPQGANRSRMRKAVFNGQARVMDLEKTEEDKEADQAEKDAMNFL